MKTLFESVGIAMLAVGFFLVVSEPDTLNWAAVIWKFVGFAISIIGYRLMNINGRFDDKDEPII